MNNFSGALVHQFKDLILQTSAKPLTALNYKLRNAFVSLLSVFINYES